MCPPKIPTLKLYPPRRWCRRWGFWGVIRSRGQSPKERIKVLITEPRGLPCPFCHARTGTGDREPGSSHLTLNLLPP